MKFGACIGTDAKKVKVMADAGFDYFETNVSELASISEEEFEDFLQAIKENGLPCEAANCFVPGDIALVGPEADPEKITAYIKKAMARASKAGVETIVFGSGKARRFPEGLSREDGNRQIAEFLREIAAPEAAKYGIRIAIEPLNTKETNSINSVHEGMEVAEASGCENVKTLADLYHMFLENDPFEDVSNSPGQIIHAHIANAVGRCYPKPGDGIEYIPFINSLKAAGCTRCSVEAGAKDFENEAPLALALLRTF